MIYIPKMITEIDPQITLTPRCFLFFPCCPKNDSQVILEIKTEIGELKGAK